MSEKELREFAKNCAGDYAAPGVRSLCWSLLEKAPDLVWLLRWAYSQKREHEGLVREARKKTHSPLPEANALYWQIVHDEGGLVHTYGLVIEEIEKVVRLTDGGYEWTD